MLDTKLKNLRRTKNFIILCIVLIPAILLVSLYPQMEKAVNKRQEEYEIYREEAMRMYNEAEFQWELQPGFVHMATETAFWIYSDLLGTSMNDSVDQSVLMEYGWHEDAYQIKEQTIYYASYDSGKEPLISTNTDLDLSGFMNLSDEEQWKMIDEHYPGSAGFAVIRFNATGNIDHVNVSMRDFIQTNDNYHELALGSVEQYKENADHWGNNINPGWKGDYLIPKNFEAVFILKDIGSFGWSYFPQIYEPDIFNHYMDIGAWVPVLVAVIGVALAALLLPFVKKLETGWEKLFSLPFEIIGVFFVIGLCGGMGMTYLMTCSSLTSFRYFTDQENVFSIIDTTVDQHTFLQIILVVNVIGWAVCFLLEYIVVASFRQFLCGPKKYIKERVLTVRLCAWIINRIKRFFKYLICSDLNKMIHRNLILFIIANTGICVCMAVLFNEEFIIGAAGFIVYALILYLFFKKYAIQIKTWYQGIVNAANQMAQGNLKITIEEDYGVFQNLGEELKNVQKGFSKAVIEEARSQNMKTELITNVSHDLKTPLTAIVTYVDLLKKEDLTEEERKNYVGILDQKSQRLKVLIEDLFEVSKAASGNIQMNFMDVDIVSLMKEVRLEMEEKISASDLNFKWNLPEEKIILSLDGQKTYRVFENLLNNILKYSLAYSRVYVDIMNEDQQVRIVFRNISAMELPEDVERLTERFVRGDASRQTEGSGLGLAIAKSFVELQNGSLDIAMDGDLFKVTIVWSR